MIIKRLEGILEKLAKNKLIDFASMDSGISATVLGEAMSRFYVAYDTMTKITQNGTKTSIKDLLDLLSKSKENEKLRSKNEERKILTQLNKDRLLKYHIEGSINTPDKKCFVLYQAAMSCIFYSIIIKNRVTYRKLGIKKGTNGFIIKLTQNFKMYARILSPYKKCGRPYECTFA